MARLLNARELQEQYGELLCQPPYQQCSTGYILQQALASRQPPIPVSVQVATVWLMKYRVPEGAQTVSSAQDLEERYGDTIRHLGLEYPSAYKFCRALREMEVPVCISDSIAQVWLQKYARHGEVRYVQNAGHLETL